MAGLYSRSRGGRFGVELKLKVRSGSEVKGSEWSRGGRYGVDPRWKVRSGAEVESMEWFSIFKLCKVYWSKWSQAKVVAAFNVTIFSALCLLLDY